MALYVNTYISGTPRAVYTIYFLNYVAFKTVFRIRDPVLFCPMDLGSEKGGKSGSGLNITDNFFESMKQFFWIKLLKFFDADPGSGIFLPWIQNLRSGMEKFGPGIRHKHPGSATLVQRDNFCYFAA
jgi:hypothetical protein